MRMRIARAHHLAAVLENLHVADSGDQGKLRELRSPRADDLFDFGQAHAGQRQIVPRREAHDAADARLALGYQQALVLNIQVPWGRIFFQRGEVILEDKCGKVLRIARPTRALIARTKIAGGIVLRPLSRWHRFNRALPGTLGAMRGDQYPFASESIEPPVRLFVQLQFQLDSPREVVAQSHYGESKRQIDASPKRTLCSLTTFISLQ